MSRFRRIKLVEPYTPQLFLRETSISPPKTFAFPSFFDEESDLLDPTPRLSSFRIFDFVTDLIEIEKSPPLYTYRRIQRRVEPEFSIQRFCDRVSALESRFEDLVSAKIDGGERKYTVTVEIKGPVERKYKWTTEINHGKNKEEEKPKKGRKYKWIAEIEEKNKEGPISKKYTFEG